MRVSKEGQRQKIEKERGGDKMRKERGTEREGRRERVDHESACHYVLVNYSRRNSRKRQRGRERN